VLDEKILRTLARLARRIDYLDFGKLEVSANKFPVETPKYLWGPLGVALSYEPLRGHSAIQGTACGVAVDGICMVPDEGISSHVSGDMRGPSQQMPPRRQTCLYEALNFLISKDPVVEKGASTRQLIIQTTRWFPLWRQVQCCNTLFHY
jgi:hypothetical protein